jgi:SAM-dependent methyltransferase
MENEAETLRLDIKTDNDAVRRQAAWCGLKPGLRVLDVGCGPGKTTHILHEMVMPGGSVVGIDFSPERINYAIEHYGARNGIDFFIRDLTKPLTGMGMFDVIWVRFVLEYYRKESLDIVRNLRSLLNPGGCLCLIDLDHNCLCHHELPPHMAEILPRLMAHLDSEYNFDTYAGRKLYSYLYDLGFENIEVDLTAHHLIYGEAREADVFNWMTKVVVSTDKLEKLLQDYPGGASSFFREFKLFFLNPRRFTYTPLILCKGTRPHVD